MRGLVMMVMLGVSFGPSALGESVMDMQMGLLAQTLNLRDAVKFEVLRDEVVGRNNGFVTRLVILKQPQVGTIRMKIRSPEAEGQYPVLFMATGIRAGMNALDLVSTTKPVITVAYDYPVSAGPETGDLQLAQQMAAKALQAQGQIAAALLWLQKQVNVQSDRVVVFNVSFGTFIVPAAQRLAQLFGFRAFATVFAFGGARIENLIFPFLQSNLSASDFANIKGPVKQGLMWLDPEMHLSSLSGQFLVIRGRRDSLIPVAATEALFDALPFPKKMEILQRGHINVDQEETLRETNAVTEAWLNEIGLFEEM